MKAARGVDRRGESLFAHQALWPQEERAPHQALVCPTSHGFFSPHLGILGWTERLPQGRSPVS